MASAPPKFRLLPANVVAPRPAQPSSKAVAMIKELSGICQPIIERCMRSRRLTRDDNPRPSRGCTRAKAFPFLLDHSLSRLATCQCANTFHPNEASSTNRDGFQSFL